MIVVAAAGLFVADLTGWRVLSGSVAGYLLIATVLLAIGLFSSTYEISRRDLAGRVGLVLNAVTFGVVFKALLTAGIMYALFRVPEYLVLGSSLRRSTRFRSPLCGVGRGSRIRHGRFCRRGRRSTTR